MKLLEKFSGFVFPKQFGLRGVLHKGKLEDNEYLFFCMLYASKKVLGKIKTCLETEQGLEFVPMLCERLLTKSFPDSVVKNAEKKKAEKPKEWAKDELNEELLVDLRHWRKVFQNPVLLDVLVCEAEMNKWFSRLELKQKGEWKSG